jgi:predicted dehydrogenase
LTRIGVAGLGRSGIDIHIKSILKNKFFSLSAVCDPNQESVENAKNIINCPVYNSLEDMLKCTKLDFVVIASPTKFHYEMAKKCLHKNISVLIEKPFTKTLDEFLELQAIAKEKKIELIPFLNFRYKSDFLFMKSKIDSEIIGKPFLIKRCLTYFNRRNDWQSKKSEQGGILNAAAIHAVDQCLRLKSNFDIDQIFVDHRKICSKGDAPDFIKILIKFSDECLVDIEISWAHAETKDNWKVYGDRGFVSSSNNNATVKYFNESDVVNKAPSKLSYFSGEEILWSEFNEDLNPEFSEKFYYELSQSIKSEKEFEVNASSAINLIKLIEKIESYDKETKNA